ncbi:tetratricopeptide repeat protein [Algoriphagus hitonicola]|uniref:Tetratricopeptide repeat-containing protein n=1 Tax=Algoriphagus hitonicola TaxID=435880 RepID=A0A1I2TMC7_9BACT|nr:hypothetical protein [Algoriphagus hitonicola]SFG66105.1 hypothetical protein SAMN04487988_106111 [Algoriphagus hitonicola]
MNLQKKENLRYSSLIPALLLIITGGLFAYYQLLISPAAFQAILPASFLDTVAIPFDWVQMGPISFPILVDNFLIFQEFKSLPSPYNHEESLFFGVLTWVLVGVLLSLVSEFKKLFFLAFGIIWILVLTLSNFNGLNIGGVSSNYALILAICGSLIGPIFFHIRGGNVRFPIRLMINLVLLGSALAVMIKMSGIQDASIYLEEHALIPVVLLAGAWLFWNGHGLISGIYILIARASRQLNLRVSVQILILGAIYLLFLGNILLSFRETPFALIPIFNPLLLVIPVGVLGWFTLDVKTKSGLDLIASNFTLKALYLLGFGLTLWLIWRLDISVNQPGKELIKHLLVYSQIGFSLFFLIYLFSNFLSVMDTGKAVDKIIFKPFSLPYYHLRIGGLIAMLVIIAFTEGIVGVQANALSNQVLGDYYYRSGQKLEASIIYENAWSRYRNNPKAKNTTAQLLFELNQPTLAKQHLEESFSQAPQVDNVILLADRLHRENKLFESIYYLENALRYFPEDHRIKNNLALFYTKVNRSEEALNLLAGGSDPISASNFSALSIKSGKNESEIENPGEIPQLINELARQNALGNYPEESLITDLKNAVETENSPMLVQAAWRNIFSIKDFNQPDKDLEMLDSLWSTQEMTDYIMPLQETAVIRSLAAGRITDAVKNLNGLAFRNPGDAGYFLHLSSSILAQQADFARASRELMAAEEKGFQAFKPHHWIILTLGGYAEKAIELREKYELDIPDFFIDTDENLQKYLDIIRKIHQLIPEHAYNEWSQLASDELKSDLAVRVLAFKAHGLNKDQLENLGKSIQDARGESQALQTFLSNPDLKNQETVNALMEALEIGDELTSNPFLSPLIWSAVSIESDPLKAYELVNSATEFNQDPLLWIKKVQLARQLGLDNYATGALEQMSEWVSPEDLEKLQLSNF